MSTLKTAPVFKLLVVEDEVAIARDIYENLEGCGYRVVGTASSGEAAIEQVAQLRPDLVLMDIVLPGHMDGITSAHQIWNQFRIPVVYLTAYGDEQTLNRARSTNAFGYVMKPFADDSLRAAIEIALDRYDQFNQLQQQTQDAMHQCKTYTAIATHEFRNFLTTIQSSVDVLQFEMTSSYQSSENLTLQLELLQMIQDSVSAFNEMIDTTLSFAKANDQSYVLETSQVECVEFCRSLLRNLSVTQRRRIVLMNYQPTIEAHIDTNLFTFILNNLISNALKYSPSDKQVVLTLESLDDDLVVQVKDEGIGIPKDYLKEMFKPFQRAKNACNVPGTGIGLSTTKRCVDLLGGSISVRSNIGDGTTFTVRIPLYGCNS